MSGRNVWNAESVTEHCIGECHTGYWSVGERSEFCFHLKKKKFFM